MATTDKKAKLSTDTKATEPVEATPAPVAIAPDMLAILLPEGIAHVQVDPKTPDAKKKEMARVLINELSKL